MDNDDGLEVVLSPLQLAAIMENDTIEQSSSVANRFWGAAEVVGGAVELIGATALLLAPEPTTLTKIAGGALAIHGSDTASTGIMQLVTGRTRTTLTSQAAAAAARAMGADPNSAEIVGVAVDVAVPLIAGFVGAARALAIRAGRISLIAEEAAGGHTIARHVGRTEAQLELRLAQEPKIPAATSFATLGEAETAVADCVRANKAAIKEWAAVANPGQTKSFTFDAGRIVGYGVIRGNPKVQQLGKVVVVLRKVIAQNRVYFVLTSYPKPF